MRFTFRQLEYFIAAGECGSITQASQRTNISAPSISTAISHLERECGVQLFVRHHAEGLSLTSAGRAMLLECKQLIQQARGLTSAATDINHKLRGEIRIGCFVTLVPMIMPELTYSFGKSHPEAEIRYIELHQEDLLNGLQRADIDVAITYDLSIPDEVAFIPLATLPPYAMVGEASRLRHQSAVTLADLAEQPWVVLDLPLSHDYFLSLFAAERVEPQIGWRSQHHEIVRAMVANGYGYALFNVRPRNSVALDGRQLYAVPLAGEHRDLQIGLATLKELKKSRLCLAFEEHCRLRISSTYIPGMVTLPMERSEQTEAKIRSVRSPRRRERSRKQRDD